MGDIVITPASNDVNSTGGILNIRASDAYPVSLKTSNVERVLITSAGLVGIGTATPTGKLHVYSPITGDTLLKVDGTNGSILSVVDDLSDSLLSVNNSAGLPVLEVFADDRVVAGQYGSGDFVLANNRVGIGTTNPNAKLQIAGASLNVLTVGSLTNNWGGVVSIAIPNSYGVILSKENVANDTNRVLTFVRDDTNGATIAGYNSGGTSNDIGYLIRANASSYFTGGNIGIGTNNPLAALDVRGRARVQNNTAATAFYVQQDDGSNDVVEFYRSATSNFILKNNGNVGIGISTPSTPLHVFNTAATLATFTRDLATDVGFSIGADSNGTVFSTAGAHAYLFYTNGTEKVRITSDGSVGIGTNNPAYKLDISGGSVRAFNNPTTNNWGLTLENTNVNGWGVSQYFRLYGYNSTPAAAFDVLQIVASYPGYGQADFLVKSQAQSTAATVMSLLGNGRAGIGTNNPSSLLSVGGPGSTTAASGLTFGGDAQANLYRSAEDIIKTDGGLYVAGDKYFNGSRSAYILARGTGANNSVTNYLAINGTVIIGTSTGRGLTLTIINGLTFAEISTTRYDTYGSDASCDSLATAINAMTSTQIGVITSFDAWERDSSNLRSAALNVGLTKLGTYTTGGAIRKPYVAIFNGTSDTANATSKHVIERMESSDADASRAVISTYLTTDGSYVSIDGALHMPNALYASDADIEYPILTVNSVGNVGIGTTNGGTKLEVYGVLRVTESSSGGILQLSAGASAVDIASTFYGGSRRPITFTLDNEKMRIEPNGRVGIGTNSALAHLHVTGQTYLTNVVASVARNQLTINTNGANYAHFYDVGVSANNALAIGGNGAIGTVPTKAIMSWRLSTENVGIGLTNPEATSALHIKNVDASAKLTIESADNSESLINFSAQSSEYSVGFVRDGSNVNSLRFCAADNLSSNEVMRLQDTNVGIGTNNPVFGLDVYKDTLRSLSRVAEKAIVVTFPNGVANQKVDIIFDVTPGQTVFWGNLEVEITDGFSNQLATGKLIKVFALGLNPATGSGPYGAALYDNASYYTAAYGAVANNYAIDGIFFNTTTGKYYITIVHITSTGNVPVIKIKGFSGDPALSKNIATLTAGSVYTTNTTVYYKPVVETLQSRIGYNGNINQTADLIVQGSVGVGTTSPTEKLHVHSITNSLIRIDAGSGYEAGLLLYASGLPKWEIYRVSSSTNNLNFYNYESASSILTLTSANVGVGTTPNSKLHIHGNTNDWSTSPTIIMSSSSVAGANIRNWRIGPADTSYGNFHIGVSDTRGGTVDTNAEAQAFTITYDQKVGLGIIDPVSKLDVRGSHAVGYGIVNVISTDSCFLALDSTSARDLGLRIKYNGTDKWLVGVRDSTEAFHFSNSSDRRVVSILQNGNLGIGTTNSATLLGIGGPGSTSAASGITFGGDAQANLYRSAEDTIKTDGSFIAVGSLNVGSAITSSSEFRLGVYLGYVATFPSIATAAYRWIILGPYNDTLTVAGNGLRIRGELFLSRGSNGENLRNARLKVNIGQGYNKDLLHADILSIDSDSTTEQPILYSVYLNGFTSKYFAIDAAQLVSFSPSSLDAATVYYNGQFYDQSNDARSLTIQANASITGAIGVVSKGGKIANALFAHTGNIGIGIAVPSTKLEVNGGVFFPGTNGLYMGGTAGSLSSWQSIQYASAGNHVFSCNGFIINNAGYVISPRSLFELNSDGVLRLNAADGTLKISSSGSNDCGRILLQEKALDSWSVDGGQANGSFFIRDEYNSATRLSITSAGRVGIGITNPTAKLFVMGEDVYNYTKTSVPTAIIADDDVEFLIGSTDNIDGEEITLRMGTVLSSYYTYGAYIKAIQGAGVDYYKLAFGTSNGAAATTKMTIANDGKVGIGTTDPLGLLTIHSNGQQLRLQTASGPTSYFTNISSLYDSTHPFTIAVANNSSSTTEYFGIYADGGGSNNRIALLNGNVGIGITNPQSKLDVRGTLSVYQSANSDYIYFDHAGVNTWRTRVTTDNTSTYIIGNDAPGVALANKILNITNAGRVGIGVVSPATLLGVGGAGSTTAASGLTFGADSQANLYRISSSRIKTDGNLTIDGQGGGATSLVLNRSSTSSENGMAFTTAGTVDWYYYVDNGSSNLQIQRSNELDSAPRVRFDGANRNILFNLGGGNIGVGTATPTGKVHIFSAVTGDTLIRADGTNGTIFSVIDDLSDSLLSVNNSAGIPVLEVFADDRIVGGQYGSGDFVITNNKVGIGTTNPANKLSVIGNASIGSTTYNSSGPTNGLIVEGNVGIGTISPASKLHVKSSTAQDGVMIDSATYSEVAYRINGSATKSYLSLTSIAGGYVVGSSANSFIIRNDSDIFMTADAGVTSNITIKNDGKVGIGITNPSRRLHIDGGNSTTVGIYLDATGIAGTDLEQAADAFRFQVRDNVPAIFYTNNTERVRISNDGNVGIGNVSPNGARVHIKGDGSVPVLRVETALLVGAAGGTAGKTFVGWMPIQTGAANPGDTVFIPLYK